MNLQGVSVPEQVAPAQQDAIKAREDKERSSLEAQTYANDLLPRAGGEASRLEQDAQAYLAQKVAEAEGGLAALPAAAHGVRAGPGGDARERLYFETVEQVLRNSKKVLLDTKGSNNMLYLPLDRLLTPQGSVTIRDVTPETTIRTQTPSGQPQGAQDPARARGTR